MNTTPPKQGQTNEVQSPEHVPHGPVVIGDRASIVKWLRTVYPNEGREFADAIEREEDRRLK